MDSPFFLHIIRMSALFVCIFFLIYVILLCAYWEKKGKIRERKSIAFTYIHNMSAKRKYKLVVCWPGSDDKESGLFLWFGKWWVIKISSQSFSNNLSWKVPLCLESIYFNRHLAECICTFHLWKSRYILSLLLLRLNVILRLFSHSLERSFKGENRILSKKKSVAEIETCVSSSSYFQYVRRSSWKDSVS